MKKTINQTGSKLQLQKNRVATLTLTQLSKVAGGAGCQNNLKQLSLAFQAKPKED